MKKEIFSARFKGLISCQTCHKVTHWRHACKQQYCEQCGAIVKSRFDHSLTRTWALVIASIILYLPANLLPIMQTRTFLDVQQDTIMSGVILFWNNGSYAISAIIFIASVVVPILKLGVLIFLLVLVHLQSHWRLAERTRLYCLTEKIGRWSMLDIYVVAFTVALVQFGGYVQILPGTGAIAFCAVVILTMLAAQQFDTRLMWDISNQNPDANE